RNLGDNSTDKNAIESAAWCGEVNGRPPIKEAVDADRQAQERGQQMRALSTTRFGKRARESFSIQNVAYWKKMLCVNYVRKKRRTEWRKIIRWYRWRRAWVRYVLSSTPNEHRSRPKTFWNTSTLDTTMG